MRFANLIFVLVSVITPKLSWAQSPMPVGAGAVSAGGGGGSNINPNAAFVPAAAGLGGVTPTAPSVIPNYYGTGGGSGLLSALGQACTMAGNALMTQSQTELLNAQRFGKNLADESFKALDNKWAVPKGESQAAWGELAGAYNKHLNGKCEQKFIDKNGNLGQWGTTLHSYIENHPDPFLARVPRDVTTYCPRFTDPSFDDAAKKRFYTYLMMVMAQPESTCNPTAVGRGPNGAAIGLFQLEKRACDRVGVIGSSSDLQNPRHNMECAVAVLAKELRSRDTITTPTSKGFKGTYWAPLRNDIESRLRSGNQMAINDTKASRTFQHLAKQYKECYSAIK